MVHKIPTIQPFSLRREWYMVTALALAVLMLCLFSLDGFCFWGDDYAAYINQAIALSEGRFDEQARLNYIMHPSIMVEEAEKGELVYVWGYPLILSLCYALAGFDRTLYTSIALYKLPSVLALAWLASQMAPGRTFSTSARARCQNSTGTKLATSQRKPSTISAHMHR